MTNDFRRAVEAAGIAYIDAPALLAPFSSDASGRRGAVPLAIVRPRDTAQITHVVKAAQGSVRLIPISSPHGPRRHGDTVCDVPAVIVDLSGMDRVIHVSAPEAIAVIEPGVTFPAFAAALAPHGLRPYQPLAPRAGKSVLTAFLEREPVTVPGRHWDSADPLGGMELVFGNGDPFRTGGAYIPGTLEQSLAIGNRHMYPIGPGHNDFGRVVQGAQGALGIVTWSAIYCQRVPAIEVPLVAGSDDLAPLVALAYRQLRRRGDGQMFIVNRLQLALLLAEDISDLARWQAALPRWALYIELTAADYFPDEAIAYRRALIDADAAALGLGLTSDMADRVAAHQRAYAETSAAARLGLAEGEVMFLSQLDRAAPLIAVLESLGECAVHLQPRVHGVNAHCGVTWLGDDAAVLASTSRAGAERAAVAGAFLSRPAHPWADVAFARDPYIAPLLRQTKDMLDPARVLQPGALSLGEAA